MSNLSVIHLKPVQNNIECKKKSEDTQKQRERERGRRVGGGRGEGGERGKEGQAHIKGWSLSQTASFSMLTPVPSADIRAPPRLFSLLIYRPVFGLKSAESLCLAALVTSLPRGLSKEQVWLQTDSLHECVHRPPAGGQPSRQRASQASEKETPRDSVVLSCSALAHAYLPHSGELGLALLSHRRQASHRC